MRGVNLVSEFDPETRLTPLRRSEVQGIVDPDGDGIHAAKAVDRHQQPALAIRVQQRRGLRRKHIDSAFDRLRRVVGTPVINAALKQPGDEFILVDIEMHDGVQVRVRRGEHPVEIINLRECARIPVKDEAARGIPLLQTRLDQGRGDAVGHILAGFHDGRDLKAKRGPKPHLFAKDVPGGDRGDAENARQPRCLGSLADAGRADNQQPFHRQACFIAGPAHREARFIARPASTTLHRLRCRCARRVCRGALGRDRCRERRSRSSIL